VFQLNPQRFLLLGKLCRRYVRISADYNPVIVTIL
jgi:hypothetical protein